MKTKTKPWSMEKLVRNSFKIGVRTGFRLAWKFGDERRAVAEAMRGYEGKPAKKGRK